MLIIGARTRSRPPRYQMRVEFAGEMAPSEVPPMSKPISFLCPRACAVRTMPTMPPAARENGILAVKSLGLRQAAGVLHEEIGTPGIRSASPVAIAAQIGDRLGIDESYRPAAPASSRDSRGAIRKFA